MAKWRSRAQLGGRDGFFGENQEKRARGRRNRLADRSLRIEPCEERKLFAVSPSLIAVIPNEGAVITAGASVTVAPRELTLRFDDGQLLDASSLSLDPTQSSITIVRSNFDGIFNGNDVPVNVGYIGLGANQNEVVIRFAENLPDDRYQVRVSTKLENTEGDNANAKSVDFDLNLGPQVIAVVPQPVSRSGVGNALTQATNQIVVYFNNDDMSQSIAETKTFYQLIRTNDTLTNIDDGAIINPTSVSYNATTDKATLTFAAGVLEAAGTWRLRVGNTDPIPVAPTNLSAKVLSDLDASFATANSLGNLFGAATGLQSAALTAQIQAQTYGIEWPGMEDEPGHRQTPEESHILGKADTTGGIKVQQYSFPNTIGGNANLINEEQRQRFREIFALYSEVAGIQFVEVATGGWSIGVSDIRYIDPFADTGGRDEGGTPALTDNLLKMATVMNNAFDWGNSTYGGDFFKTALKQVGQFLKLGDDNDLPGYTSMGENDNGGVADGPIGEAENVFPGDADIVHMQNLFRPDVKDIDTYKFTLTQNGKLTLETVAQRRTDNTTTYLDSVISLYNSSGELIARNDDYFGRDSYVTLDLAADTYYVAISASGNTAFDLNVNDSGLGGRSQGKYDLRMNFEPVPVTSAGLTDATGTLFDGDSDGKPGGEYNFWFKTQVSTASAASNRVIWVDKLAPAGTPDGTLAKPYANVALALANSEPGDIVRIVGNNITVNPDGTINDDNAFTYNIGRDILGNALTDGATFEVPKGVTVMIDEGAIFRLRGANIDVGTSAEGIDESAGALQVLGTPSVNVYFTSWHDQTTGVDIDPAPTTPARGDWGGIVFREDSDLEEQGIFLNYVNHADIKWGGGLVASDSAPLPYTPIHILESRPTLSYNKISESATAAISADPNSFQESVFGNATFTSDYGRVGPDIHGNRLTANSINALFVRISTPATDALETLTTQARFDDTDIVHVLAETLLIQGDAGGARLVGGVLQPRISGRLSIDPGIVMKLAGARIETAPGAQFLAEGTAQNPVIFTSAIDDRYGRGGTFDTTSDGSNSTPSAGDWAGLYFGPTSSASIDHALLTFGGGFAGIDGGQAEFNVVEIQQADVRLANSTLENNADGEDADVDTEIDTARDGHLTNGAATIFVRGAQPDLINNVIRDNLGSVISINVNALNSELNNDNGRSTGRIDLQGDFFTNTGALIVGNRLENNELNALEVRGGTLTTQVIWDDADMVHVLQEEIAVGNLHTYGGLRLQSKPGQSLVVKLLGDEAGFTASGLPLDIDDRIGGVVQVMGVAGAPVILTSLNDDSVGAGLTPSGEALFDTNNDGSATTPAPGDWRSVKLDRYSHDRNVQQVNELEQGYPANGDANGTSGKAQYLGQLAPDEKSGDDNVRLGFEVVGAISQTFSARDPGPQDDRLADVDVYSFKAKGGTEVWLDIDRTSIGFDSVVELVDLNGAVIARSNDSLTELENADLTTFNSLDQVGTPSRVHVMQRDIFSGRDFYSTNPKDAGLRVVLTGSASTVNTYYVRVRSNGANLTNTFEGTSYGKYQLQVRLREKDETAGSTVQFADIRYATNGIEVIGKPESSPILGESTDNGANNTQATAQDLGNLLASNLNTLSVSGLISADSVAAGVDWYSFSLDYRQFESISGSVGSSGFWPAVFDLDYADGIAKVNASIAVFDQTGKLVYWSQRGGNDDDSPRPLSPQGDAADLSRGSFGTQDPYIGSVDLQEGAGATYYVAVSSSAYVPLELSQFSVQNPDNPLFRLEPVAEYNRIWSDRVTGNSGTQDVDLTPSEFHLGDVVMFVNTNGRLFTVDPLTGAQETDVTGTGQLPGFNGVTYGDLAMRNDGRLYVISSDNSNGNDASSGNYNQISTGDGQENPLSNNDDGIDTLRIDPANPVNADGTINLIPANVGMTFSAYAFIQTGTDRRLFAIGSRNDGIGGANLLYELDPNTGAAIRNWDTPTNPLNVMLTDAMGARLTTAPTIFVPSATDIIAPTNNPGDFLDGQTLTVAGPGGSVILNFNTGPSLVLTDADNNGVFDTPIADGETFTVNGTTFEFDQGTFLNVSAGNVFADGDTFTVTTTGGAITFELDLNNNFTAGRTQLPYTVADNAALMTSRIANAINTAFGATIAAVNGTRITLTDPANPAVDVTVNTTPGLGFQGTNGIAVAGNGLVNGANVRVRYEESETVSTVGNRMATVINNNTVGVTESFLRNRLTLRGAVSATEASGALTATVDNPVGGGQVAVSVDAADSSVTIATRITSAINSAAIGVTAIQQGDTIQVQGATAIVPSGPITVAGAGAGGVITGLAEVNGTLYAVSDEGGLFSVGGIGNPDTIFNASLTPITVITDGGAGIEFTGLTTGPQNVEESRYADMLFATDANGNIWAFDTNGNLQPIFHEGETSISTGIVGLTGLAFSTLDYNLWHATGRRGGDAGHSGGSAAVETSYYFGLENPNGAVNPQPGAGNYGTNAGVYNTYDLPGGAYGSLTTDPIDLTGYTANDVPTLYFNYFFAAESNTQLDTTRVFASADGANWFQINTPFRNSGSWRQARIDLSGFAGESAVQIRFDFTTAGDMHVGENEFTGEIVRALSANQLRDGDTFEVDDVIFEFDLGFTVITQSGPLTLDGNTVVINGTTFEFNKTGGIGGGVAVDVTNADTAGVVAFKLAQAINNQGIGVTALFDEGVTITLKSGVETVDGDTVTIDGVIYEFDDDNNTAGFNIPVVFSAFDTAEDLATSLAGAIELQATSGIPVVSGDSVRVDDARTADFAGASAAVVANSARMNLLGATTASETGTSTTIEGDVGVEPGNVAIVVDTTMDAADVAQEVATVLDVEFTTGTDDNGYFTSVKVDGSLIQLIGHHYTDMDGILPWSEVLPGDHPIGVPDRFFSSAKGQNNAFEGIYLDDFILGFAGRGEQALFSNIDADATATDYIQDPARPSPDPNIVVGNYDLEIRQGRVAEYPIFPPTPTPYPAEFAGNNPDPVGRVDNNGEVPIQTDVRDRLSTGISLLISAGSAIVEGETFRITDGVRVAIFEFDSNGTVGQTVLPGGLTVLHQPIAYTSISTLEEINEAITEAINDRTVTSRLPAGFNVQAVSNGGTGDRIELMYAGSVGGSNSVKFQFATEGGAPVQIVNGGEIELSDLVAGPFASGDKNTERPQGYTLIGYNTISDSSEFGIRVDSPVRDEANLSHPGSVRNLTSGNPKRLVPGVSVFSNLIVASGTGGILFSGDNVLNPLGAALFGRITNNTIYGGDTANGVGIQVTDGASPTIANNILANNVTGIQVVSGAGTTLRSNLYKGNTTNITGGVAEPSIAGLVNFLGANDPLFVNAANRNFYLAAGSKAIDSSSDSIAERSDMASVYGTGQNGTTLLGIPLSPIQAPLLDALGQERADDTSVNGPTGLGLNVFKDRGAIDRVDFVGSTVALLNPLDNDTAGLDKNPATTQVRLVDKSVSNFSFQFSDGTGVGIDDSTVTQANIIFNRDGVAVPASEYTFDYDPTTNTVLLQSTSGLFVDGVYTIRILNADDVSTANVVEGVKDIAANFLTQNQANGQVLFTIDLAAAQNSSWHNANFPVDVDGDGFLTTIDLGLIIDRLNRFGIGVLPLPKPAGSFFFDVDNDGLASPSDLILVIDALNNATNGGLLSSFESSSSAPQSLVSSVSTSDESVAKMAASSTVTSTGANSASGAIAFALSTRLSGTAASGTLIASAAESSVPLATMVNSADEIFAAVGDDDELATIDELDFGSDESDEEEEDLFADIDALLIG